MDKEILGVIAAFAASLMGLGAFVMFFKWIGQHNREIRAHQLEMAGIKTGNAAPSSAELDKLRERCDALEQRCTKLEAQLLDAHALLADEQRELDKKLASILPSSAAISGDSAAIPARSQAPAKTVM
jgi:hypothetical protein